MAFFLTAPTGHQYFRKEKMPHTTLPLAVPVEERTAEGDGGGDLTNKSLDMSRGRGIEPLMSTMSVYGVVRCSSHVSCA